MNKKYVIYTSLTGNYDELPQYEVLDNRFDYICFSNQYIDGINVGQWTIKKIPFKGTNNAVLSRYAKLQPHKCLEEYDYSIWLDSNIIIKERSFYDVLLDKIKEGGQWYGIKHPIRNCIYDEGKACLYSGISRYHEIKELFYFLKKENYPKNNGLYENNLILRKHSSEIIKKIDDEWWDFYYSNAKRDQLSLFYIFWKNKFAPQILQVKSTRNDPALKYKFHTPNRLISLKRRILRRINIIRIYFSAFKTELQ